MNSSKTDSMKVMNSEFDLEAYNALPKINFVPPIIRILGRGQSLHLIYKAAELVVNIRRTQQTCNSFYEMLRFLNH